MGKGVDTLKMVSYIFHYKQNRPKIVSGIAARVLWLLLWFVFNITWVFDICNGVKVGKRRNFCSKI
jgi:hypothetical protein